MPSLAERFWAKVDRASGHRAPNMQTDCWLWTASKSLNGYGKFVVEKKAGRTKLREAHRVAWMLTNGSIPDGLYVCHHCDVRTCVRPDHLFVGTAGDNMRDCEAKGRNSHNLPRTHCPRGHQLDEANTYVRVNRKTGAVARVCRECGRQKTREFEQRTRAKDPEAAREKDRAKQRHFRATHPRYVSPSRQRRTGTATEPPSK